MPTSLHELDDRISESDIAPLAQDATMNDTMKLSRIRPLDAAEVEKIYRKAM